MLGVSVFIICWLLKGGGGDGALVQLAPFL